MATGNSGSFSISGSQNMTAVVYWSETYNESANTHVVSINRIMLKSSNWYGFTLLPQRQRVHQRQHRHHIQFRARLSQLYRPNPE